MKKLAIVATTITASLFYAQQKIDSYTANNGITYKIGDKFTLGEGSSNGDFQYLKIAGIFKKVNNLTKNNNPDDNVNPSFAGKTVTLKKIKNVIVNGREETVFIVNKGMLANYELNIEEAIANCEIKDCDKHPDYAPAKAIEEEEKPTKSTFTKVVEKVADEDKKLATNEDVKSETKSYLSDDKMEALLKLKKLKDAEILSDEEFQKEKNKILN